MEVPSGVSIDSWLDRAELEMPRSYQTRREETFSPLEDKLTAMDVENPKSEHGGGRSLRTLPFSMDTFKMISTSFCTHGSIARVISRADIPIFSSESVVMSEPAYGEM